MKFQKRTEKQLNNSGMTLIEMVITFALMGIFLAAVTAVISSSIIIHSEMTATMYAQSVGEILLDKAAGELAAAKVMGRDSIVIETIYEENESVGERVTFYDKNGNHTKLSAQNGFLMMEGETSFAMDEKAYMGYRITGLWIKRLNQKNVFEIIVELENLKTGFTYTASRVTECYQFETQEDFAGISVPTSEGMNE